MPRSATALGIHNDFIISSGSTEFPDGWYSDPTQLTNWQEQLVVSCLAIRQQLFEIKNELTEAESFSNNVSSHSLRLVCASSA